MEEKEEENQMEEIKGLAAGAPLSALPEISLTRRNRLPGKISLRSSFNEDEQKEEDDEEVEEEEEKVVSAKDRNQEALNRFRASHPKKSSLSAPKVLLWTVMFALAFVMIYALMFLRSTPNANSNAEADTSTAILPVFYQNTSSLGACTPIPPKPPRNRIRNQKPASEIITTTTPTPTPTTTSTNSPTPRRTYPRIETKPRWCKWIDVGCGNRKRNNNPYSRENQYPPH